MVEAIEQGVCTVCESSDNNYTVDNRKMAEDAGVTRELRCDCGEVVYLALTEDGIVAGETISHEDASWNESDEE